jgi:hypothetical protein
MIIHALNALGINSEFCVDADVTTEEHYLRTYRDLTNQNRFFEWSVVWAKMQELQAAEPLRQLREQRNQLLQQSDWRMVSDYPDSNQSEWQTYRQSLRDITTQSPSLDSDGNLTGITWPTPPND